MGGLKLASLSFLLVLIAFDYSAVGDITTDGLLFSDYQGKFSFVINDTAEDDFCLRASFGVEVKIYYNQFYNISYNATSFITDSMPTNVSTVSVIGSRCSRSDGEAILVLSWNSTSNNSYTVSMTFNADNQTWALYKVDVNVTFYSSTDSVFPTLNMSSDVFSSTNGTSWFKRPFYTNQYYHCDAGQNIDITLPSDVISSASTVRISRAVIYMGTNDNPSRAPCLEDWIAEQEKIVPIIVGGVLAVLLALILTAYIVSFIQRKRKEKLNPQYEQLGGKE